MCQGIELVSAGRLSMLLADRNKDRDRDRDRSGRARADSRSHSHSRSHSPAGFTPKKPKANTIDFDELKTWTAALVASERKYGIGVG